MVKDDAVNEIKLHPNSASSLKSPFGYTYYPERVIASYEIRAVVSRASLDWTSIYKSVVWAQLSENDPHWPAFVYDPRSEIICTDPRVHCVNKVQFQHVVYFFGWESEHSWLNAPQELKRLSKAPYCVNHRPLSSHTSLKSRSTQVHDFYGFVPKGRIVSWEEGLKKCYHLAKTAGRWSDEGSMERALAAAQYALSLPAAERLAYRTFASKTFSEDIVPIVPQRERLGHGDDYISNKYLRHKPLQMLEQCTADGIPLSATKFMWTCNNFTFLNEMRARKCMQCFDMRKNSVFDYSGSGAAMSSPHVLRKPLLEYSSLKARVGVDRFGISYQVEESDLPALMSPEDYSRSLNLWDPKNPSTCNSDMWEIVHLRSDGDNVQDRVLSDKKILREKIKIMDEIYFKSRLREPAEDS